MRKISEQKKLNTEGGAKRRDKGRSDREGPSRAVLYGRKPALEVFRHRPHKVKHVYVYADARLEKEITEKLEEFKSGKVPVEIVSSEEIDKLTNQGRHQGIAVELTEHLTYSLEELIRKSKLGRGILVVADQVTDPHNLGAMMRCAEAAGADGLISTIDRSAPFSSAMVRASAGASEFLPIVYVKNLQRALRELKDAGFWIAGLQLSDSAGDVFTSELPSPLAVVLGSEGRGIRRLTERECDLTVAIPMEGFIESLNVSQATAVFLFEMLRRRRTNL